MCKNWPDLPMDFYGATGGLIGNTVLICGGYGKRNSSYRRSSLDDCYSMTSQKVTLVTHLSVKRFNAASIVLNDNTLWVTGGRYSRILPSTEYVTISGTLPGPDLPFPLYDHALVAINSTCSMVIGGRGEYNVEHLKLSCDHHENCKTHPKENKKFIYLFLDNKRAC